VSGKAYAGPEVDVWSCGVVLYALLCSQLPFDDPDMSNLFKKIRHGNFSLPPILSPEAKDLIVQLLIVDPTKRITIAQVRKHPWFRKDLPRYLQPSNYLDVWEDSSIFDTGTNNLTNGVRQEFEISSFTGAFHHQNIIKRKRELNRNTDPELQPNPIVLLPSLAAAREVRDKYYIKGCRMPGVLAGAGTKS